VTVYRKNSLLDQLYSTAPTHQCRGGGWSREHLLCPVLSQQLGGGRQPVTVGRQVRKELDALSGLITVAVRSQE
jgi:hypothetical protein